jgi:hypothetical protein
MTGAKKQRLDFWSLTTIVPPPTTRTLNGGATGSPYHTVKKRFFSSVRFPKTLVFATHQHHSLFTDASASARSTFYKNSKLN